VKINSEMTNMSWSAKFHTKPLMYYTLPMNQHPKDSAWTRKRNTEKDKGGKNKDVKDKGK